ncbi:MAG: DUF2723 domain-containing protein [Patescibacteria group bacterium]|nr:DUF2723 domain-containing protein [Patescibacteria group bacterium]
MKKNLVSVVLISVFGIVFYLVNQSISIYGGDGGDLVAAALVGGIPHPPGYPLFTFLGFLLTKIPFSTPAWRVGLLSSLSSIATLVIFFLILQEILKNKLISLITTLILATTYLFWLYSIVPEVFALNNLFFVLLIYLLILWSKKRDKHYLYLWFFILGLSFTHHHTIILLLPSSAYFLYKNKQQINRNTIKICILLFFLGLLPLLYLPLSALRNPAINWEDPVTFSRFFRLVTRASYGTFKIGSFTGDSLIKRLLSLLISLRVIVKDFGIPALMTTILGIFFCFKKQKEIFIFFGSLLVILFFFIFYASFPLVNDFLVGTFERFLLLPEIIFAFFLGFGMKTFHTYIVKFASQHGLKKYRLDTLFQLVFLLIPLSLFTMNYPKINILKNDTTAENLASDILESTEQKSILLLFTDTPLFSTQYLYYWKKNWSDVRIIHTHKLQFPYYRKTLNKYYPDLYLPPENSQNFMQDFFKINSQKFSIFSKEPPETKDGKWIPQGLLVKYYPNEVKMPEVSAVIDANSKLWASYHNPMAGSLKTYTNLILSDVLRVYGVDHETYGLYLFENTEYDLSEAEFRKAMSYFPDVYTQLMLGQSLLQQKKCVAALGEFMDIAKNNPQLIDINIYLASTYGDCFNNEKKKNDYLQIYEGKLKEQQVPLKKI